MRTIAALCLLFSSVAVQAGSQFCYECSSKSALCRHSVYDGQYLTRTPCSSSCFLRTEGNTIYRGCFDGWLGGIVKHDYVGCRTQEYLGEKVEWCFCKSLNGDSYDQPCNGASRDALSKMALPYVETELETKDKILNYEPDEHTKYFLPTDTRKYPNGNEGKKDNMITYDIQYEEKEHNIVLNDEFPLNIADKTVIENEETPDKTRIDDDTEGIEICIRQTDGTYADPNDCTKYYHCSNSLPYRMSCSQGTIWNDKIKSCTFIMTPSDPCRPSGLFNQLFNKFTEDVEETTFGHYKYGYRDNFETAWSSPND